MAKSPTLRRGRHSRGFMRSLDLLSPLHCLEKVLLHRVAMRLSLDGAVALQALTLDTRCMLGLGACLRSLALKPGLATGLRLALSHVSKTDARGPGRVPGRYVFDEPRRSNRSASAPFPVGRRDSDHVILLSGRFHADHEHRRRKQRNAAE